MKLATGQVAVVTGAASGIGLALARAFCERGLAVALLDIEKPALDDAARTLRNDGHDVEPFVCDVADAEAVTHVAGLVTRRFGKVDVLVNNAGVGGMLAPLWLSHPNDWNWAFGVNVHGVVNGVRAFLPNMIAQGSGHVINTASLAGLTAPPFLSTYVASKHAVVGLSESLAAELAITGSPVKVSVVCPGMVTSQILTSERNRPQALQAGNSTPPALMARLREGMANAMGEPMPSDDFAKRVIDGIERNDFYVLTHPNDNDAISRRLGSIEQAVQAHAS
jgi:NAD(P)-dependent dehydrogenase (short-subunit alcohol dehydrogenase family)